ncbi:hypothetical protein Srubr_24370 [Streptomyces rubradiris]|uniref:Uncharacterized protein n=1 Tax=Streptomyces rubradiris TaxID=285531 RepID=A0ABQ3R9S0_STRRR|nr:hypothetical protein GCM10018792_14920 [Streptomyces rubradiris]GHI52591.1 hypothetical protein Srubr_24370 [Streptomyces rubradiris]
MSPASADGGIPPADGVARVPQPAGGAGTGESGTRTGRAVRPDGGTDRAGEDD